MTRPKCLPHSFVALLVCACPSTSPSGGDGEGETGGSGEATGEGMGEGGSDGGSEAEGEDEGNGDSRGESEGESDSSGGDEDTGEGPPTGTRVVGVLHDLVASDVIQGWCSTEYVPTLERFLTIFVNHYSPGGYQNNSLRAFDPTALTVEAIHPENVPGAPQDRDNHQMVYNPTYDELWVFSVGGLVLDVQSAWADRSTPPSYGAVGWSDELDNPGFAERAGIVGWPEDFRKFNAVVDWSAELDTGVIFGGVAYTGLGVKNDLYIIRPHPDPATARYQLIDGGNFDAELAPPGYVQDYIYTTTFNGRHNGRIIGDSLYTLSIDNTTALTDNGDGTYSVQIDLLRFPIDVDVGPVELERMTPLVYTRPGPLPASEEDVDEAMRFPCITYDDANNVMLAYLTVEAPSNLWAYLVDLDMWVEVETETPVTRRRLAACDYSADHGLHVYLDGMTDLDGTGWSTIELQRLDE